MRKALDASAFDWSVVPQQITIHIARGRDSDALPGHVFLDADLLDSGRFSWGVVQHEYAHEVDFFALDDAKRTALLQALGGKSWCDASLGLEHSSYGCERFASTLAWAYWPSSDNAMAPTSPGDEAAALAPARFRVLLAQLLGTRQLAAVRVSDRAGARRAAPRQLRAVARG